MTNVTLSIDDELLKKARLRAIEQGTSVNAEIRRFLEKYAGTRGAREASVQRIVELAQAAESRRGPNRWTRDQLHER